MNILQIQVELKNFLDDQGRLTKYPSKMKLKMLSLFYLTSKFEPDMVYTQAEVGAILDQWHTFNDRFMLRRDLCDHHFFDRTTDGSAYTMEEKQPTLADFHIE